MKIKKITNNKKQYLDLLLLADEQENMIDKYLEAGDMFALYDDDLKSICVVLKLDENEINKNDDWGRTIEIKNIATYEKYQGLGYGRKLINYIFDNYKDQYETVLVGTGDSPLTIPFYKSCGFEISHKIKNFFVDNYDIPIYEDGKQLIDMIYLKKTL